jgi:hypothetical protein
MAIGFFFKKITEFGRVWRTTHEERANLIQFSNGGQKACRKMNRVNLRSEFALYGLEKRR